MTLEELNAARDAATREALLEGGVIARAQELLADIAQLGAVGVSAGHVEVTLKHFVAEATSFLNRTAPSDAEAPAA